MMIGYKLLKTYMNKLKWASLACLALIFCSCGSEYDQLVRKEMKSGIQKDSLLFDLKLGQTKKEFYAICWDLNKAQIISQGSGNQYARYDEPIASIEDPTRRKRMDFFGTFDEEDVMHGMEMIFSYLAWAPWNKDLQSEQLLDDLKQKIIKEYGGNDFIEVNLKSGEQRFVKVDGNMQFLMFKKSNKEVLVRMEDLNYKLKDK